MFEYVTEDDWNEGIDLFQENKVISQSSYETLINLKVETRFPQFAEVRLKIHAETNSIQWIECTCKKNRKNGQYCEHIVASCMFLENEKNSIFKKLNQLSPLRAPSVIPRARKLITEHKTSHEKENKLAHSSALSRMKNSIEKIGLANKGPELKVYIQIGKGELTNYILNLDEAASFIEKNPELTENLKNNIPELVSKNIAFLGFYLYLEKNTIYAEKIICIEKTKNINAEFKKNVYFIEEEYVLFPLSKFQKMLGKSFFFVESLGYFKIKEKENKSLFNDKKYIEKFEDDSALELIKTQFETFNKAGHVFLSKELSQQTVLDTPELSSIELKNVDQNWFFLDPKYGKGDSQVSMVELIKRKMENASPVVRSGNQWLKIPKFVDEFQWQLDDEHKNIKVDRLGLIRIKAALGEYDDIAGSKSLLETISGQISFRNNELKLPDISRSKLNLRTYQSEGLQWFWWLYKNNLHGLLADEMGLGKTHQAMGIMTALHVEDPMSKFLVVCPTTVLDHWLDKVEEFTPNMSPIYFHGPKRKRNLKDDDPSWNILITSYGIVLRDLNILKKIKWKILLLDEAHFVKNSDTASFQAVCSITSQLRLCLSGTPIENHLGELKNIYDFLLPGYLGSDSFFKEYFRNPIEVDRDKKKELILQRLIHPFKLRRKKSEVLAELPEKVEDIKHCNLSDEQVSLYKEILEIKGRPIINQLKDEKQKVSFLHVFAILHLLKRICDHPCLVLNDKNYAAHHSGKFELLKELVEEALESEQKIVIFSQYIEMIHIISLYLTQSKIKHVCLTGSTQNRGEVISQFQKDPETKIFIGSLMAGGIGIDLTAASVVIHYDRWWNASKENQATDRVHRIGQSKNVQVYKLLARGTLEEKIDRIIKSKHQLFDTFINQDEHVFKNLSREELINLME